MAVHALLRTFQIITLAGVGLTAAKLFKTGLYRRYPVFFCYFAFRCFNESWPLMLNIRSGLYYWFWVCTLPLNLALYILVVRELCGLVLEKYRGLYTLGRWAIYLGMSLAVSVSLISVLPRIRSVAPQWKTTVSLLAADRGVTLGLAVFLLLMMSFLRGYPVCLSRNVVLHATLYTIFFICNALDGVLESILGVHLYTAVDAGLMGISALCVVAWLLFLNPAGEEIRLNAPYFSREHEQRILYHLEALNATILKVSRK